VREYYEWQINRIPLADGRYGVVCYFRDISAQVRARDVLRESEEQLRALTARLGTEVMSRTAELEQRNAEILKQADQLRELSRRLLRSQDDERRHIARELHDSAGQTIAALSINLARAGSELTKQPTPAKRIEDSQMLLQQLNTEIRTMSYLLHPPLLEESGLRGAIRWYIEGLAERAGLEIDLDIGEDFGRLSEDMELALFRIVQECLTNILRHSGSKTAFIGLARNAEGVSLTIEDNGRGIPAEKLAELRAQRSGVGFTGMRERVRHFGGEMTIESSSNGTKIEVRLPVAEQATLEADNAAGRAQTAG
jgi:signal transduction histidine kinase